MITGLIGAFVAFLATNVDDLMLVMILGAEAGDDRARRRHIWTGQMLAIGVIVGISLLGALLTGLLPAGFEGYLRYLGVLPILIGLWHIAESLLGRRRKRRARVRQQARETAEQPKGTATSVLQVFLMLFMAGADNAGVYIPLFSGLGGLGMGVSAGMYMALAALVCLVALKLAGNSRLEGVIQRYEAVIVPVVLILIGVVMLLDIG